MVFSEPDYPHIVLTFPYKQWLVKIEHSQADGRTIYSVWAHHRYGCAVIVPVAYSRKEALQRAKKWIEAQLTND